MSNMLMLLHKRFGRLLVISISSKRQGGSACWNTLCDCGKEKVVPSRALVRGRTKSCGCLQGDVNRRNFSLEPYRGLYNAFKNHRAKLPVVFTFEEFLEFTKVYECHYCGKAIVWDKHRGWRINLDRKDNSLSYTKDNCVVCCKLCNYSKSDKYTYEEWKVMASALKAYKTGVPSAS